MGLDNIPHEYACVKQGSALFTDDGKISCERTQSAGQCPWQKATEGQDRGIRTYGLMGTDCWFRGKAGHWMLETLVTAGYCDLPGGDEGGFYGIEDQSPNLSPEFCTALSDWMKAHVEPFAKLVNGDRDEIDTYRYAAWWLGWVGQECGGADAWW